ncbi:hypothetical protein OUZ56_032337 [Daphnia magna]|uniref:peptidylprolyl isomerase n=1 Tax=Daphnia magna TaxID=35525 RepID=A0ABR0B8K9_9CRUS|nr:hypothetical protein OUZ56_032337 [Daphnia magna]
MQVTAERISPVVMQLSIEVPAEAVKTEFERAYQALEKTAHIKGFRKGKTPREVLKKLFAGQVKNDVANNLVQNTLGTAISQQNVQPINQPMVQVGTLESKTAFGYKAIFEVQPDISEVVFEGFELKRPSMAVDDDMVAKELEGLQQRFARFEAPAAARAAKAGDLVTIDFTLAIDGKDVKDGGAEGVQLELGSGQLLPELDTAITGAEVGKTVTAEASFGEGHPRADFRNKNGEDPPGRGRRPRQVGRWLRNACRAPRRHPHEAREAPQGPRGTRAGRADRGDAQHEEQLRCPPSLVDAQRQMMQQEFLQQLRRSGQRFSPDQARQIASSMQVDAEKKVRAGLLMAAIAKKNEFKVTEEDIENGMKELAEESGQNVAKIRTEYREKQKRDMLVGMILEDKILDFIESKSTIVDLAKGEDWRTEAKSEEPAAEKAEAKKTDKAEKAEAKAEKPAKAKAEKAEKSEEKKPAKKK